MEFPLQFTADEQKAAEGSGRGHSQQLTGRRVKGCGNIGQRGSRRRETKSPVVLNQGFVDPQGVRDIMTAGQNVICICIVIYSLYQKSSQCCIFQFVIDNRQYLFNIGICKH